MYTSALHEIETLLCLCDHALQHEIQTVTYLVRSPSLFVAYPHTRLPSSSHFCQLFPGLALDPEPLGENEAPVYLSFRTLCCLARMPGDYNVILWTFDAMVERFPNDPFIWCVRARALWPLGYFAAAAEDLLRAIDLDCENPMPYALLGETYYFLEHYHASERYLSDALLLAPAFARGYCSRAMALAQIARSEVPLLRTSYYRRAMADLAVATLLRPGMEPEIRRIEADIMANRQKEGETTE